MNNLYVTKVRFVKKDETPGTETHRSCQRCQLDSTGGWLEMEWNNGRSFQTWACHTCVEEFFRLVKKGDFYIGE